MSDDLVKRLRNKTRDSILKENDRAEAADRIEDLTAKLAKAVVTDTTHEAPDRIWIWGWRADSVWQEQTWQHEDEPMSTIEYARFDLMETAEQQGYANAMEAERKLHEDRIKVLTTERERLALAICGGEDAPGYANAQTVETLEHVAKQNQQSHGATINSLLAAEAERDRLRKALENIVADYEASYPPSHGAIKYTIKYAAKLALKGGTP